MAEHTTEQVYVIVEKEELKIAASQLVDVKIEIPVVPPTFYAAGRNYVVHTKEMLGSEHSPKQPDVAYRGPGALIARSSGLFWAGATSW